MHAYNRLRLVGRSGSTPCTRSRCALTHGASLQHTAIFVLPPHQCTDLPLPVLAHCSAMSTANAAAAASSSSCGAGASSLWTLRLFGIDPGSSCVADFLREHGSFELLAWYGDALLQRFITEQLWANVQGAAPTDTLLQKLHDQRALYTSNASLACFLRSATDIEHPTASSDHSLGTLFEFLLALLQRTQGDAAALTVVQQYRSWLQRHADLVSAAQSRSRCVPLMLSWHDAAPMNWRLQQAGHASIDIILTPDAVTTTGTRGIMHLIEHVREQEAAGRKERDRDRAQMLLAAGIKRQTTEQQRLQQELQASVKQNPFGNVSVPLRRSLQLSAGGELVACELAPAAHCGVVVQVEWWSLKKYFYREPFWSCCGMRGAELACNKPNWADPSRVHPGTMEIPRGSNKYRVCLLYTSPSPRD